jgi:endothelin-converting enzyme/putative endopeptidase
MDTRQKMALLIPTTPVILLALLPALASASSQCSSSDAAPLPGEFAPQGLNTRTFSKAVRPGDDFFNYVNEGWIQSTEIPPGHWDYGQTTVLISKVEEQIRSVIAASVARPSPRFSAAQQVGDAYSSFLNVDRIEHVGSKALARDVKRILASKTPDDVVRWMAHPTSSSIVAINLFPADGEWRVHLDQQNSTIPMLGLSGREAYERTDGSYPATRAAYQAHIAKVFELAGVDRATARAQRVVALEGKIAANQWTLELLRDRKANFHPMSVQELTRYAPGFPWPAFLEARGVGNVSDIVLGTDTAVKAQAQLFANSPLDDWRSYIAFHWIQNQIDVLPRAFRDSSWAFYGQVLSGAKAPPARDDVALRLVNSSLGHPIGRLYVERYFSPETKAAAQELIAYLRKAFEERLNRVPWMDEATRAEAQAKLARTKFKVGYPTIWRDFSDLDIRADDAAGNLQRIRESDWAYQRKRLAPDHKDEPWYQTPQTVDASYSVLFNAIELPAAFLQPPYFDAKADPAVNFGAIGGIIGHEMGHGFDDQGIIYDSQGRMRNWWSAESLQQFHSRAQALIEQYNAFSPYEGVHVNGQRTIGENIADLSGLSLAHRAYQLYLADRACAGRTSLDGLSGEQRFFLSWAQGWRYKAPESAIRWVIDYGYHVPTPYRVNGVVQNMDEWYEAFGIQPTDKLYVPPEKRVRIW